VNTEGITILQCPQCGNSKKIDTKGKNLAFKKFKAKCRCGARLSGQFEFRCYHRKKVRLQGSFLHPESGVQGKIVVENISLMGVGFTCSRKHDYRKGDVLEVTFNLDDPQKSKVTLPVTVVHIRDRYIGAQRRDTRTQQPTLGFYLK
jgi:hypothetical protein